MRWKCSIRAPTFLMSPNHSRAPITARDSRKSSTTRSGFFIRATSPVRRPRRQRSPSGSSPTCSPARMAPRTHLHRSARYAIMLTYTGIHPSVLSRLPPRSQGADGGSWPPERMVMRIEFDIPETILHHLLDPVPIPQMARVRYDIPTPAPLRDIRAAVREQMERAGVRTMVRPGQRIAVGVGSRGIGRLPEIVAALVGELRALGAEPFIIPTMGSHGGATADGQREVLLHLGVTPERVGAPIEAQMETV